MMGDEGRDLLLKVEGDLARFRAEPNRVSDEELVELRRQARAAIDRLDDEPEFEAAHELLDRVGEFVRNTRPKLCLFAPAGDDFEQTCPVALGHIRLGMSIGAEIEESECSICGQDPWECPHIPGREYGGEIAGRLITKANLLHVAVVQRPDFADARFMSEPISRREIEMAIGGPLPVGGRPRCDRCLSACPGVHESPLP